MIIVLGGVKGSGKDTVGNLLNLKGFVKESFAKPLKEMVVHAFPAFTKEDLYGSSEKRETLYKEYPFSGKCTRCGAQCQYIKHHEERGYTAEKDRRGDWVCIVCGTVHPAFVSPRLALQTLGTEWGRRLSKNVWVNAAFSRMTHTSRILGPTSFVITDCRFFNEVQGSKDNGAFVVKLTRGLKESTDLHSSEAEFKTIPDHEFDYILDNKDCSLDQLPDMVNRMLAFLKEEQFE